MQRLFNWKWTLGSLVIAAATATALFLAASCGTAPRPFPVFGPGVSGNAPPSMSILEPVADITRGQGDPLTIRWTATDPDDNASVSFSLINVQTNESILLVEGISEDRVIGTDLVTVSTSLIPIGTYQLRGTITDGVNEPVEVFARTSVAGTTPRRVLVRVVGPGEGELSEPPTFAVSQPSFNLSISQGDILTVVVQPVNPGQPYNSTNDLTLYILLDVDTIPTNDDPANPDPSQIIRLRTTTIIAGSSDPITFNIPIDLNEVPPLTGGGAYFVRATADDGINPRVHQYASGAISIVRPAAGLVDLFNIGRTLSGARFYGFTPGANLGSSMTGNADFDADGVDDFVLVAQFGNPRNFGPIGEAYLIYGLGGGRFGGSIAANTVSDTVSGVIFEAPPVRADRTYDNDLTTDPDARTDGITTVSFIQDITFDGRPELMVGMRRVHGAYDTMDYDPGDEVLQANAVTVVLQQGQPISIQFGDTAPIELEVEYNGAEDTTIRTAAPDDADLGSSPYLRWFDNRMVDDEGVETGEAQWALIKFKLDIDQILGLINSLPPMEIPIDRDSINLNAIDMTLELFGAGGGNATGSAHQMLPEFEPDDTLNTLGEPVEGETYPADNLDDVAASAFNTIIPIDISDLGFLLFSNALANEEVRVIIVPDEDATTASVVCSSNSVDPPPPLFPQCFSIWRPRLTLTFGFNAPIVANVGMGCYSDPLINNRTNAPPLDLVQDTYFYSGGMVALINSENRDSIPRATPTPTRLESTSIALELVGQRAAAPVIYDFFWGANPGRRVIARADDYGTIDRIAGSRLLAGGFDYVDPFRLRQPPREGWFGTSVAGIGDLNQDGVGEIMISAPRNELHLEELFGTYGFDTENTHWFSSAVRGSIVVYPGTNYFLAPFRDKDGDAEATSGVPHMPNSVRDGNNPGQCSAQAAINRRRDYFTNTDGFEIFAEHPTDMLGGASSAGDFNLDGLDDILAGAPFNNKNRGTPQQVANSGAVYIIYGRSILGNFMLANADDPILRAPMLRIRGLNPNDRLGTLQTRGLDVNGDRIDDIMVGAPLADRPTAFGGLTRTSCSGDLDCDGQPTDVDPDLDEFELCRGTERDGTTVFCDDPCKQYDFNNNGLIDDDDRCVFCCLSGECDPDLDTCTLGLDGNNCCANMVDQGFVGIIYGGVFTDGDRDILQIGPDPREGNVVSVAGTRFWGSGIGHQAGHHVASAGDFNGDGYGDILIVAPGERFTDSANRVRVGVVYLIFGGPHLVNKEFTLTTQAISSGDLPGLVFYSPYVKGRPNEARPLSVAGIGDINNDGFDDIAVGIPGADFIDLDFPQGPNAPGTDASVGRRRDAGDAYIIYGNNFGTNRPLP